ncbi:MAG TPA: nitronate monooxygenase [Gammaproteobacteria bacterium]|nr:nitronate monooxygenase [Gammaproteobacteria bacterium]
MNQLLMDLKIKHPIIQAPMALADSPALVAAISNQGGLGSLGAALFDPEQIRQKIKEIRHLTNKPFNINLFAPTETPAYSKEDIKKAMAALNYFRKKLGIPPQEIIEINPSANFDEKLSVILEEKIPVFSFTFGVLSIETIKKIKTHGIKVIGTATTVREARLLEKNGVDAIVVQGYEAGGHRGTDLKIISIDDAFIGTMALVPQVVDAVKIPVIASGGIMDGRGIIAALALGASGVQMGTAFLACPESSIHPEHRKRLISSTDESTRLTKVFTGRMARSLKNEFLIEMEKRNFSILDFPVQSALVKDIREESKKQNNPEYMSLWGGQASSLCRNQSASEVFSELLTESNSQLAKISREII